MQMSSPIFKPLHSDLEVEDLNRLLLFSLKSRSRDWILALSIFASNNLRCACAPWVNQLPIQKKGGGLRPIAVGEVLRRLTSKCLSKCVKDEAFQTLTPLQVGVGVKVGCETVVHAVSRIQEDPAIQPSDKWTLLLDFSNAFNSISRSHMFMEIQARIPILTPWMESCYGTQPFLHLGDHTILSSSGVQQGILLDRLALL